jgi:succinyl-CoA synthetase beta subunit
MNVHEFQAKSLFAQFGVPVPRGREVKTPQEAEAWATELNSPVFVVKAQIHAGGRGKAGGVKITKNKADVPGLAKELLGKTLVTHQTGPKGREVHRLLIEEGAVIAKELYLSILVDRDSGWPVFIASTEGGMEIEEVAAHTPEKIIREAIDPAVGFQGYNGRNVAFALGCSWLAGNGTCGPQPLHSDVGEPLSPLHGKECRNGGDQSTRDYHR